ncbi:hypothetical protein CEXT_326111 [Caerostris extrusa]|uniref:DUF295 domain-containing protein n=1 Tax=Caerostris extrusa TaxID=172846 RepID=A0AAV4X145_CAEEX|nr:hypothetical protein CEXT_326111 [Caerostris extrusa]
MTPRYPAVTTEVGEKLRNIRASMLLFSDKEEDFFVKRKVALGCCFYASEYSFTFTNVEKNTIYYCTSSLLDSDLISDHRAPRPGLFVVGGVHVVEITLPIDRPQGELLWRCSTFIRRLNPFHNRNEGMKPSKHSNIITFCGTLDNKARDPGLEAAQIPGLYRLVIRAVPSVSSHFLGPGPRRSSGSRHLCQHQLWLSLTRKNYYWALCAPHPLCKK